jgi:tRNA G26 N,N-dimethylase Trm1
VNHINSEKLVFNWVPENPTYMVRYYAEQDNEEVKINEIEQESMSSLCSNFGNSMMEVNQIIVEEYHAMDQEPFYLL